MSLRRYLEMAYKEVHLSWKAVLDTVEQIEATLQPNRENLILVYGGSFNPPHRGHMDVLLSGLRPEVGAIATVILPCEDYLLRSKMGDSPSDFFLHMSRRATIWDSIKTIPKDRVWVWTNTYFPFRAMIEALIRLTKADGFNVAFSHMIGPDILRLHDPLIILPCISARMLVTNKARHDPAHFLPDGKPKVWSGFGEWCLGQSTSPKLNEEHAPGAVMLWTCKGAAGDSSNAEKRGYYLQFAEPNPVDINSTYFRGTLTKDGHVDEESLNRLCTDALMELLTPVLL